MTGLPDPRHTALLVVDLQPDFLPGGALPVAGGDAVIAGIARLLTAEAFAHRVASQDWHPPGHVSFASSHPGRKPLDVIELHGREQVLWPDHCVQGTPGARLHPDVDWRPLAAIIRKGMQPDADSYSAFRNNWDSRGERRPTGLAGWLREREVTTVVCCGLARDYCVRWTAEDAVDAGFDCVFLWDLTRPVDPASDAAVRAALTRRGVTVTDSATLA